MPKLSQYEIEREANIARNRALLEELELKQAVDTLGIPKTKAKEAVKSTAKPVQPKRIKREREVEAPRRQSARLKRETIDPNESPAKRRKREEEMEKQRIEEEEERLAAEERARIAKRPRHHDLDLNTLTEEDGPQDLPSLTSTLQKAAQISYVRRIGDPEAYVLDYKKEKAAVAELREKLEGLKIVSRAKVTQDRVYSAAYHPEVSKDLIFFGDKHGQLGIWDARAPPEDTADEDGDITLAQKHEGGRYWRLQQHWPATSKSSISSIRFDPLDAHTVYTTSYDCTVRSLSFTTGISREIFATDEKILLGSMDLVPSGQEMWISDGGGGATHLDLREAKFKARRYMLSDAKVGCISVNPSMPHFLLTSSNSRYLKIWDARKLGLMVTDLSDKSPPTPPPPPPPSGVEDEALEIVEFEADTVSSFIASKKGRGCLRTEWKHDKSVSSAYWDPRGRQVVSTSYDDTLRLWDFDPAVYKCPDPFPTSKPFSRIKHDCQTGKWLTILRAQWNPNPDIYPHFTIGNMKHSLDIFSCKGDLVARLADPIKITAVQAVTCSHPSIVERAVSGNASGRCVLWAPEDD